ncbi:MFS transporter [Corynebacterium sp. USCH3]|uniref:MFS transporter n=1 Tax=Corynebacterium sp. USCH3 TaxID=3024840 RepID=UPI0030EDC2DB
MTLMTQRSAWYPVTVLVAFAALLAAAGFRSAPGVLMDPLHSEFGWSHGTISGAVSLNLLLFGLFSPFATSLMERFGVHRVAAVALGVVGTGSALSVFVSEPWQLWILWGFLIGAGTGAVSMPFAALVAGRWFTQRRGLVSGILTAASSTGQLVFLPLLAHLAGRHSWQAASLVIAAAAVLAAPVVFLVLKDRPQDVGLVSYGQTQDVGGAPERPAMTALGSLRFAARRREFWLLAGTFAVCGATTVGLVGTHFVPSAHDHGMPATTAASLLAVVGIFDILGTLASGWLTDRIDPRILLVAYYGLRGLSLVLLPMLMGPVVEPPLWAFIIFYGLDWVATVPPTMALCREHFGQAGPVVFGWVFASHQLGAGIAAAGAGVIRDSTGSYDGAWFSAAALCGLGVVLCLCIRRAGRRGASGADADEDRPVSITADRPV